MPQAKKGALVHKINPFALSLLPLIAFAAPQFPGPAIAQRSVEFGYKDRIFEQKYVLPDALSALDAQGIWTGAVVLAAGGVRVIDARLLKAAGGACAYALVLAPPEPQTPAQVAIDRMPKVNGADDPNVLFGTPASAPERCFVQLVLFRDAMEDNVEGWSADAMVVDVSAAESAKAPKDEPRSACGSFGYDGGTMSCLRVFQGYSWFYQLGQDQLEIDSGSFTVMTKDDKGEWARLRLRRRGRHTPIERSGALPVTARDPERAARSIENYRPKQTG